MNETQRKAWQAIRAQWVELRKTYPALNGVSIEANARLKRRLGYCRFERTGFGDPYRAVKISVARFVLNEPAKAMDTFLHEVAHALAGHSAGHGPEWKRWCTTLGCEPARCGTVAEEHKPAARYIGTCGGCGFEYRRHRKSKAMGPNRVCGECRGGLTWKDTRTGREVHYRPRPKRRSVEDEMRNLFGF